MVCEICIEKQKPHKLLTYRILTDFKNFVRGLDNTIIELVLKRNGLGGHT